MSTQEMRDALFIYQDTRANFKNIIAKRSDLIRFDGGRIISPVSGTTLYYAGTVLGYATSGPYAGKYEPYLSTNSDGSQVAVGILAEDALVDSTGNGSEISIVREGTLFQDLLVGLDGGAITALGGKPYIERGNNLITIRA